ncbi:ankyrin repeat domain-containing protein [uncultured Campylobacter sp.]|uniref:ankyrin repeat domain-containing protein n=1 Tax=uncultured Campylobacter sp. TaxID=218934 RepID=UPI002623276A|nr:ankyrin repeat domain-containing protein [uncultured Campylobacter sp.]
MQTFFKFLFTLAAFAAILFYLSFLGVKFGSSSMPTGFTITPDTKIDPNSELAKYVTQEEIEAFGFGVRDIVCDKEKNATLVPLRAALDRKDTDFVVKFIKDNNLSVDVSMRDKRTPLMYSSFRNDVNTFNALLNLGADIRAKDRFGLSSMAYAIMLNSVDTARILLEKGVKFEEVEYVSPHIHTNRYYDSSRFDSIIINDDDNITIRYKYDQGRPETDLNNPQCVESSTRYKSDPFFYVVNRNLPQMAELMLSTGYKPREFEMGIGLEGIKDEEKNRPLKLSGWAYLGNYENYEPMLDVFIKYDLPNAPTKEQLKEAYEVCYDNYLHYKGNWIDGYMINNKRPFYVDMAIKNLEKYCTDPSGTFQDARSFIAWANEQNKVDAIYSMRRANRLSYIDNRTNNKKLKINQ